MRRIEPMGRMSAVPPTHQGTVSNALLPKNQADCFYDLLQDAASACHRTPGRFAGRFRSRSVAQPASVRKGLYG
ncbi:MAG: hypothetical protein HQM06_12220 [Magnetococcales bacterium]|nr:hypothetical protein [Magnetococcales bacterium]